MVTVGDPEEYTASGKLALIGKLSGETNHDKKENDIGSYFANVLFPAVAIVVRRL